MGGGRAPAKLSPSAVLVLFLGSSCTRTRPGLPQSLGCSLAGSKTVCSCSWPQALAISLASGLATASSLLTRRPSARDRAASKYTGKRHWKFLYAEASVVVRIGRPLAPGAGRKGIDDAFGAVDAD